jgi:undecaprenyl-diphosphatase
LDGCLINAALKGVLEGFTEFLPISSTGHLILVRDWLPLCADPERQQRLAELFDVVIQFPAILAIVALYRRRLWEAAQRTWAPEDQAARSQARRFWLGLAAAFVPVAVLGKLFHSAIEARLESALPVACALLVGGVILIFIEKFLEAGAVEKAEAAPLLKALGIGCLQCLALLPGTSRSAACIIGGRALGLTRTAAAEYSFFLAVPTLGAAAGYKFLQALLASHGATAGAARFAFDWAADGPVLLVGSLTSFLTAWAVVALFLRYLQKHSLAAFGWYRIALSAVVLLAFWRGWIR